MKNLKKLFISLLALLTFTGFTAVSAQGLTVWTHVGDQNLEYLQEQATSFETAFGTPVEIVKVELGEIKQKMLLGAPEGEAADLIVPIPHDQIGEMAAAGVLADMSAFATSSYLADLNEQARLGFTFNNKLFGIPMYVEGPALIVNRDLVSDVPASLEEMLSAAQDLTNDDQFGLLYDIGNFYFSYVWINSMGGYVFGRDDAGDLNPDDLGLDNEGAISGFSMIQDLRHKYELIPEGTDYGVADGLFIDGALAMTINGPWAIPNYKDAGIDIEVMPIPPTADGQEFSGFMGVQGIAMNEFSTNKIDAANFAKWITRSTAQVELANLSGFIPSSNAAAAEVSDNPVISGFATALTNAVPMPNIPEMGNVWGPMGDALTVVLESSDSDVASILSDAASQIRGE